MLFYERKRIFVSGTTKVESNRFSRNTKVEDCRYSNPFLFEERLVKV